MLLSRRDFKMPLMGVCALVLPWAGASGAITYSGLKNLAIPTNFAGIYIDFDDASHASSYTTPPEGSVVGNPGGDPPVAGVDWDVNFFWSGLSMVHSPDFQPFIDDNPSITNLSQILNVATGTTIDSTSAFGQALGTAGDGVSYGGSGNPTGGPTGESHFTGPGNTGSSGEFSAFTIGQEGYLAFVADVPDGGGSTTVYGWMRVTFQDDGSTPGTIHDWAWSDTTIDVGQVPEPSAAMLILLGSAALLRRRRI